MDIDTIRRFLFGMAFADAFAEPTEFLYVKEIFNNIRFVQNVMRK